MELPKRAVTTFKSVKELIVTVPDLFKEEVVSIDEGSIECLEFLSDGTYFAAGCSSGLIKIVSSSQSKQWLIQRTCSMCSKAPTTRL